MDDIKEKYDKIKSQVGILKEIKKDDKIYYINGTMYLQSYSPLQSLYRSISRENRHLTFRYLEIFISDFIDMYNDVKKTIKYIQTPLLDRIIKDIPKIKEMINKMLKTLLLTYPTNEKMINILINNISSC